MLSPICRHLLQAARELLEVHGEDMYADVKYVPVRIKDFENLRAIVELAEEILTRTKEKRK